MRKIALVLLMLVSQGAWAEQRLQLTRSECLKVMNDVRWATNGNVVLGVIGSHEAWQYKDKVLFENCGGLKKAKADEWVVDKDLMIVPENVVVVLTRKEYDALEHRQEQMFAEHNRKRTNERESRLARYGL